MQAWGCLAWNKYSEQTTHCPVLPFILVMMLVSGHSLWPSRISFKALQLEKSGTLSSKKCAQLRERSSKFAWVVKGALIFYCPGSRVKECAWGWQYGVFRSWGEGANGMEGLWQVQRWRRNDAYQCQHPVPQLTTHASPKGHSHLDTTHTAVGLASGEVSSRTFHFCCVTLGKSSSLWGLKLPCV